MSSTTGGLRDRLHGHPELFRGIIDEGTGRECFPEMKTEMVAWFERLLPPPAR